MRPGDRVRHKSGRAGVVKRHVQTLLPGGVAVVCLEDKRDYYCNPSDLTLITPEPVMPAAPSTPTPSLAWSDDDDGDLTLSLCLGALSVDVALVRACNHQVTLWGWKRYRDLLQFECRNRAEAIAVVRALIGYRCGGEVPDVG